MSVGLAIVSSTGTSEYFSGTAEALKNEKELATYKLGEMHSGQRRNSRPVSEEERIIINLINKW